MHLAAFTHAGGWPSDSPPITITYSGETQHLPSSTTVAIPVIAGSGGPKVDAKCRVINVVGYKITNARAKLMKAHCRIVIEKRRTAGRRVGRVLSQKPATKNVLQLPPGARVTLVGGFPHTKTSHRGKP